MVLLKTLNYTSK